MIGSLTVNKPGQLSLIQDFGRYNLAHMGITQGGPVDDYAYSWGNHLLANPANSASLEITLGQAEFTVNHDCELAITGANLSATLDQQPLDNWSTFVAFAGQTLRFSLPKNGLRAYLAVKGGFNLPSSMGSVATVTRDQLGGLHQDGSALKAGDELRFDKHSLRAKPLQTSFRYQPNYNLPILLRVVESYQFDQFCQSSIEQFYRSTFSVSQNIDRMGYRLQGTTIKPPSDGIKSEGIALGAIQVPPDGNPIVLLNDRQTLGGYPKLGCVARIDLPRLAQARPGQQISFTKGDLLGLQDVWCQWARFFGY
ncbi:biotin-dependent carboxyltransferase family protein [Vibrio sp.]|uniref:5-oxoprolinase subunit C family protein n=1 Tax=Vibrio sp. TaxID=678 RepID=UPI003D143250